MSFKLIIKECTALLFLLKKKCKNCTTFVSYVKIKRPVKITALKKEKEKESPTPKLEMTKLQASMASCYTFST